MTSPRDQAQADTTFRDGWMRFWDTFTLPWPVVLGFALAQAISYALMHELSGLFSEVSR